MGDRGREVGEKGEGSGVRGGSGGKGGGKWGMPTPLSTPSIICTLYHATQKIEAITFPAEETLLNFSGVGEPGRIPLHTLLFGLRIKVMDPKSHLWSQLNA